MPSIADLLTDMPEAVYPRWLTGEDRIQFMPAAGRYAMLLRVKHHWCVYVLVPNRESIMELEEKRIGYANDYPLNFIPRINYSGPGSRAISWRWYNSAGQLRTLAQLNPDGDWWIGFDTMDRPIHSENHMREYMMSFEALVHRYLHDHPSDSR